MLERRLLFCTITAPSAGNGYVLSVAGDGTDETIIVYRESTSGIGVRCGPTGGSSHDHEWYAATGSTAVTQININGAGGADTIWIERNISHMIGDSKGSGTGVNKPTTITGGDGNDTIDGGDNNDQIWGDSGADVLSGLESDDGLYGGSGDDVMDGGNNNDRLLGGPDNDSLLGGEFDAGDDSLYGDDGNDTLRGGDGDDYMEGNLGDDRFFANDGFPDTLDGGPGTDCAGATDITDDVLDMEG